MVMALGKIREARDRGRVEGRAEERAAMIQALWDAGIPEIMGGQEGCPYGGCAGLP